MHLLFFMEIVLTVRRIVQSDWGQSAHFFLRGLFSAQEMPLQLDCQGTATPEILPPRRLLEPVAYVASSVV